MASGNRTKAFDTEIMELKRFIFHWKKAKSRTKEGGITSNFGLLVR